MKRLVQVSGAVTGSGADLHAPSVRERPAPRERIHQRVVALWHVSVAPARSKRIEECGDLCPSFPRPCARARGNRPRQLSHRMRCISPIWPPRPVRYDPGQLDHAHRTQPTDDAHRPRLSRLQAELVATASTHTEWPVGSVNGSRAPHPLRGCGGGVVTGSGTHRWLPGRDVEPLRVELLVERQVMGGEPRQLVGALDGVRVHALALLEARAGADVRVPA
jgi:hypothetical protein